MATRNLGSSLRRIKKNMQRRVLLLRLSRFMKLRRRIVVFIATPTHGNLGDQAIVYAQQAFFDRMGLGDSVFQITREQYSSIAEKLAKIIRKTDLIVVDGGGNIGTLWPVENDKMIDIISRFKGNPIVVFPETAFFEASDEGDRTLQDVKRVYSSHSNLCISCRDEETFRLLKWAAPQAQVLLVPDIVLSLNHASGKSPRKKVALLCLRDDKEAVVEKQVRSVIAEAICRSNLEIREISTVQTRLQPITRRTRDGAVEQILDDFRSASLVVTDRLHGLIFSAVTGTPCVVLDNVSGKVSAGYKWLEEIPNIFFCNKSDDIKSLVRAAVTRGPRRYSVDRRSDYYKMLQCEIERMLLG